MSEYYDTLKLALAWIEKHTSSSEFEKILKDNLKMTDKDIKKFGYKFRCKFDEFSDIPVFHAYKGLVSGKYTPVGEVHCSRELFARIKRRKNGKEQAQIIYEYFFEDMKQMPVYEGEDGNLYCIRLFNYNDRLLPLIWQRVEKVDKTEVNDET